MRRKEKEEAKEGKRKVKFQLFFRQPRVAVPCTAECRGEEKERREREGRREREEGEGERKEKEKHRGGRFDSTRVETIRVRIGHALMNRVAPPTRGGERRRARGKSRGAFHISCPVSPTRWNGPRKFRLARKRSRVIDPLAVVSDGNGRASEQASNRAIEQSSNRAHDQPVHPSDARFGPSPGIIPSTLRTRTYITRARNMYDVLFCESQLAKPRAGSDYSLRSSSFDWKIRFFSPWNSIGL